jgi:hypothetical protein
MELCLATDQIVAGHDFLVNVANYTSSPSLRNSTLNVGLSDVSTSSIT